MCTEAGAHLERPEQYRCKWLNSRKTGIAKKCKLWNELHRFVQTFPETSPLGIEPGPKDKVYYTTRASVNFFQAQLYTASSRANMIHYDNKSTPHFSQSGKVQYCSSK